MTLPDQRYQAVLEAHALMRNLASQNLNLASQNLNRYQFRWEVCVKEAREILEHFPTPHELSCIAAAAPKYLVETMDPLHRMCVQHELNSLTDIDL